MDMSFLTYLSHSFPLHVSRRCGRYVFLITCQAHKKEKKRIRVFVYGAEQADETDFQRGLDVKMSRKKKKAEYKMSERTKTQPPSLLSDSTAFTHPPGLTPSLHNMAVPLTSHIVFLSVCLSVIFAVQRFVRLWRSRS